MSSAEKLSSSFLPLGSGMIQEFREKTPGRLIGGGGELSAQADFPLPTEILQNADALCCPLSCVLTLSSVLCVMGLTLPPATPPGAASSPGRRSKQVGPGRLRSRSWHHHLLDVSRWARTFTSLSPGSFIKRVGITPTYEMISINP